MSTIGSLDMQTKETAESGRTGEKEKACFLFWID